MSRSTVITRKIEFDAGHRVLGHESKCANLHGHRYVAEISVTADALDSLSRVVDFSVVKKIVGGWIDEYWDHNFLLNRNDPLCDVLDSMTDEEARELVGPKTPYLMPDGLNPTAETMAEVLFEVAVDLLEDELVTVTHVRLYETPNCWADYGEEHTEDRA